jgi:hypothetical protein
VLLAGERDSASPGKASLLCTATVRIAAARVGKADDLFAVSFGHLPPRVRVAPDTIGRVELL